MYVELPQLQILNLPKVVVKTKTGKVMVIVMMKIIILTVNGMGEIAVVQMWKKIIVIYVLVLILIQIVLIHVQNLIGKVSLNCQMIV